MPQTTFIYKSLCLWYKGNKSGDWPIITSNECWLLFLWQCLFLVFDLGFSCLILPRLLSCGQIIHSPRTSLPVLLCLIEGGLPDSSHALCAVFYWVTHKLQIFTCWCTLTNVSLKIWHFHKLCFGVFWNNDFHIWYNQTCWIYRDFLDSFWDVSSSTADRLVNVYLRVITVKYLHKLYILHINHV